MVRSVRLLIRFWSFIFCIVGCCQASVTVWPAAPVCERENVTLVCRTTLNKSVDWGVTRNLTGTTEYFYIFSTEGVLRDFADRFYVHRPSIGGFYNLTIVNLTVDDVAKYTCIDNAGIGPSKESVQLQVIGATVVKRKAVERTLPQIIRGQNKL
jgi:hypothetical protein